MHLQNETSRILFRFHEDTLAVSPPDSLESMRHQAGLHFSIVNISSGDLVFSTESDSQIELHLTVGEGGGSFFTPRDQNGWGTITCPQGFTSTGWTRHPLKKNRLTCIFRPVRGRTFVLKPGLSLTFVWDRICSTAPEGYASLLTLVSHTGWEPDTFGEPGVCGAEIMAEMPDVCDEHAVCRTRNLAEMPDVCDEHAICRTQDLRGTHDVNGTYCMTLSDTVFKKQADTQILHFFASPSTGAPGQEITLNWNIENADSGVLLPGGFDILGPVPQRSFSKKIPLDERIDRYYLNLVGNGAGVFGDVNVFLAPPVIDHFYVDSKKNVCWETHFASRVTLVQGGLQKEVNASGNMPLETGITEVILKCEGLYQTDRQLIVPPASEIICFYGDFLYFKNHRRARICWKSAGLSALRLTAWDTAAYTVSTGEEGIWEQVYPVNSRFICSLFYQTAGGTGQTVYLKNEGRNDHDPLSL